MKKYLIRHILVIARLCAVAIMVNAGTAGGEEFLDCYSISNEYSKLEYKVCKCLHDAIDTEDSSVHMYMKTAGYIGTRNALEMLCKNLDYPVKLADSDNPLTPRRWETMHIPLRGAFWREYERLPAMGAINQIGLPLDKFIFMVDYHPKGVGIAHVMADMAYQCGGAYYCHALLQKYPTNHWYGAKILERLSFHADLHNPPRHFWSFSKSNILFATNFDESTCVRYDTMKETLLSRFATEHSSASTNLPDTIATMGFIRSLDAIPILADNLTICPQVSTNVPGGYVFPAAEALISIGPAIGDCFDRLKATKPLSVEESLWLRISHELYPEGLEYELYCAAATNDTRAARLLKSLPWRRLTDDDCKPLP